MEASCKSSILIIPILCKNILFDKISDICLTANSKVVHGIIRSYTSIRKYMSLFVFYFWILTVLYYIYWATIMKMINYFTYSTHDNNTWAKRFLYKSVAPSTVSLIHMRREWCMRFVDVKIEAWMWLFIREWWIRI